MHAKRACPPVGVSRFAGAERVQRGGAGPQAFNAIPIAGSAGRSPLPSSSNLLQDEPRPAPKLAAPRRDSGYCYIRVRLPRDRRACLRLSTGFPYPRLAGSFLQPGHDIAAPACAARDHSSRRQSATAGQDAGGNDLHQEAHRRYGPDSPDVLTRNYDGGAVTRQNHTCCRGYTVSP